MLRTLSVRNFKSLRDVTLRLGTLNVFIGANASGKSNVFDALHVLQGIGYGFTVDEVFNGKSKSASSEVWEPVRGGSAYVRFLAGQSAAEETVGFAVELVASDGQVLTYEIGLADSPACVRFEKLAAGGEIVYDSTAVSNPSDSPFFEVRYYGGKRGKPPHLKFEKSRPVLHQIAKYRECTDRHSAMIDQVIHTLGNVQRVDPSPHVLRQYALTQKIGRMGERGENFAALVNTIVANPDNRTAFTTWLRELTPMEVDDITILHGALNEPLFAIKDRGNIIPATILSDGTLRFAAMTAALFQPDMPGILTIEEIENGIHASRLRLLVELLLHRSEQGRVQIMATTHSPIILSWMTEEAYKTVFYCSRDEETGESRIQPLPDIPHFHEVIRKQPIAQLFAEGWLEGAL